MRRRARDGRKMLENVGFRLDCEAQFQETRIDCRHQRRISLFRVQQREVTSLIIDSLPFLWYPVTGVSGGVSSSLRFIPQQPMLRTHIHKPVLLACLQDPEEQSKV